MKYLWIILILLGGGLFVFVNYYFKNKKKQLINKLTEYVSSNKMKEFNELINDDKTIKLIPSFNRTFLQMNAFIIAKNTDEAARCFDELIKDKNEKNLKAVYYQCFDYFISVEDSKRAKECFMYIKEHEKDQQRLSLYENIYEIMVEKKTNKLDSLIAETDKLPDDQKYLNETLIAMIYGKLNNKEMEEEYKRKARIHHQLIGKQ